MNIVFFTQEDPFYVKIFFNEFLKNYPFLDEIKAIVISQSLGKKSPLKLASQMYDFYGLYNFVRVGSKYVYNTIMGKRKISSNGNASGIKTYTLEQLACAYGLNIIKRSDLNSKSFRELIRKYDADLFISVASSIIFKKDLIDIPRLDCINIHNAPLPQYRGMLPNFWQLYYGETQAGITVHRIEVGIDTGEIISQQYVPIDPHDSLNDLIIKTKKEDARIMIQIIEDYRNGQISYKKMEGDGTYFSFPTRENVREFKRRGKRLL